MPVFNRGEAVGDSIRSVLSQSVTNWELILVDDGSKAATAAILDQWAMSDARISVLHTPNQGQNIARNTGLAAATGRYIRFLDHDDCLFPWTLSEQKKHLTENSLLLVAGPAWGVEAGEFLSRYAEIVAYGPTSPGEADTCEQFVDVYQFDEAHHPTFNEIMIDREVFLRAGGFPSRRGTCEEFSVLMALQMTSRHTNCLRHGPTPCVLKCLYPESLAGHYRIHEPSRWPLVSMCEATRWAIQEGHTQDPRFQKRVGSHLYTSSVIAWRNGWKDEAREGIALWKKLRLPKPLLTPTWHRTLHDLFGFAFAENLLQKVRQWRGRNPFNQRK